MAAPPRAAEPKEDGRRTRHRHRRAQLLDAAVDYALEHSITDLALRPLGAALGVSHKTLLYHFGTKEQLFTEIVREWQGREQRFVAELTASERPGFLALLERMWGRLTAPDRDEFLRFRFEVLALARAQPDRYEDLLHRTYVEWPRVIEGGLRDEGLSAEQAHPLAEVVQAVLHGLQLGLLTTGDRARADRGFREFVRLLGTTLPGGLRNGGSLAR